MRVVVVACRENGDVDTDDLAAKIAEHGPNLAATMITYPSTRGVRDRRHRDICAAVHDAGGQVYVDGANLHAWSASPVRPLRRRCQPPEPAQDVLHPRTAAAVPASGPIGVRDHLAPFLPGHVRWLPSLRAFGWLRAAVIGLCPYGSASILPIHLYAYIAMTGASGCAVRH